MQVMTPNEWFPAVRVPPLRGGPVLRWGVLAPGTIAGDFVATVRPVDRPAETREARWRAHERVKVRRPA